MTDDDTAGDDRAALCWLGAHFLAGILLGTAFLAVMIGLGADAAGWARPVFDHPGLLAAVWAGWVGPVAVAFVATALALAD
ncbi:hypothetical protein [Frigidibacter sp. MR17.24]|uniref:hypothetical protein n=1 Tax=Frigidibacter sp. MR17.24 TaxID=3127345 RepID=UPI003012A20F